MLGYSYFKAGERQKAAQTLAPLTRKLGPYHDRANYYYGIVQLNLGKAQQALRAFKGIENSEEFGLQVPVYITSILLKTAKYTQLESYGKTLLKRDDPYEQKPLIYQQIGTAMYELGKYQDALTYLDAALTQTDRPTENLLYLLGMSNYRLERWTTATTHFERVVEGSDTAAQGSAYYLGFTYMALDRPDDARFAFRRAHNLGKKPLFTQAAQFNYGKLSFQQKYYPDALNALKSYIETYPEADNIDEARGLVARTLYYSNAYQEALAYFKASGLRDKETRTAYQRTNLYYGLKLYEAQKIDSAELYIEEAASLSADAQLQQSANFWYGEVLFQQQEYLPAAKAYNNFLSSSRASKHDYYADALVGLGWCHFRLEHYQTALNKFREVVNMNHIQKTKPAVYEQALLRAGDCAFKQKNYPAAKGYYNRAVNLKGAHQGYALYQNGITLSRQSNYRGATDQLKRLVANYPNADLRDNALLELSDIHLTWLQDNLQTIAYARQLIAQHPTSPLVPLAILNVGLAKANSGDKSAAESEYRKVLNDYSNYTEEAAKALDLLCELVPAEQCSKLISEFRVKNPKASSRLETVSFNAARDLYYDGDLSAALRQLNNYVTDYPTGQHYYAALLLRGEIHAQQGRKQAAQSDYAEVYDNQTAGESIAQALLNAARLSMEADELEQAVTLFERAEKKAASVFDRRAAQFERGDALMQLERYQEAEVLYTTILGEEEVTAFSQSRAQLALGKVLYALDKPDSALVRFQTVAENNQNKFGAEAQYNVAKVLNELGQHKQSEEAVFAARDRFPNYGEWLAKTYLVMVENYLAIGKRLNAIETLKSLVENAPNDALQQRAAKRLNEVEAEAPDSNLQSTDGLKENPELEKDPVEEVIEEEEE